MFLKQTSSLSQNSDIKGFLCHVITCIFISRKLLYYVKQVLLVPKKKSEGSGGDQHRVLVMSQGSTVSTGQQQQQQQNVSMTWNGQSSLALALSTQSGVVQQHRVVSQVRKSTTGGLQSTVRLATASANQPQVNSSGVVAVTTRWDQISALNSVVLFNLF